MKINLGNLNIVPVKEHLEWTAKSVAEFLLKTPNIDTVGVVEIDSNLSDTAAFCEHYQVGMNQSANCVVLEAKRGDKTWFAACVVFGNTRADVNGLVRRTLDARKVSFAPIRAPVVPTRLRQSIR